MKKQTTKRKINHKKTKKKNQVNKRTKSRKLIGGFKGLGLNNENNENNEERARIAYEETVGNKAVTAYNAMVRLGNVSGNSSSNPTNNHKIGINNDKIVIDLYSILGKFDYFCFDFDDTIAHNEPGRGHLSLDLNFKNLTGGELFKYYFYDAIKLIKLMIYLKQNRKQIFIISFGDPSVISILLNKLFDHYYEVNEFPPDFKPIFEKDVNVFGCIPAPFHNRIKTLNKLEKKTPAQIIELEKLKEQYIPMQEKMYHLKVDTMERIIEENKIEKEKKILFFDDDFENTRAMNERGISAITIPGKKTYKIGLVPIENFRRYGFGLDILNKLERDIEKRKLQPSEYMIKENYLFESFDEYRSLSILNRLKIARDAKKKKESVK